MFKKIKYYLIVVFLVLTNNYINGQDATFTQFYANSLYLAPSFTGTTGENRLILAYRNQWPQVSGVFNTYSISWDKYLSNYKSGIGVLVSHDVAGSSNLSISNIGLLYSYDIKLNDYWHAVPGISLKTRILGIDIHKLLFNSQVGTLIPPITPPVFDNKIAMDFSFSTLVHNDRFWGGFTMDHLLRPEQSFYNDGSRLPIKYNLILGGQIYRKTRLIVKNRDVFSISLNMQTQKRFFQAEFNAYYEINSLVFGGGYRGLIFADKQVGDAIIGLIGYKGDYFNIGYSYDFTVSKLIGSTAGSHEITFTYKFDYIRAVKTQKVKAIPCPEF